MDNKNMLGMNHFYLNWAMLAQEQRQRDIGEKFGKLMILVASSGAVGVKRGGICDVEGAG
jgi:hypothetical protein